MSRRHRRERVLYLAARALAHLPDALKFRLSGEPPVVIDGQRLDPQLQVIRRVTHGRQMPGLIEPTIAAGREQYRHQTHAIMADSLDGKIVLITGPARGIGAAVARQLAGRGVRLALVGLEAERLAALSAELGRGHAWFECEVADQPALDRAVDGTRRTFGGIDVVVANAGIAAVGTVAGTPVAALTRVVDVNVTGVVRTVHATLPAVMARRGYVAIVSSAAAFAAMPGLAVYGATKSAVEQCANALRGRKPGSCRLARPPFDAVLRRVAGSAVPELEREAAALGRSFGAHSVESTRPSPGARAEPAKVEG